MRILVVEDEEAVREFLREALEGMEYVVTPAEDGEVALAWLDERDYDLIL